MRVLITGPAASGKSRIALDRFLNSGRAVMLLPTATATDHLRHTLARAGRVVRPGHIVTPAQFFDLFAAPPPCPPALLHTLLAQSLDRLRPASLASVLEFRGLRRALAGLLEEVPAATPIPGPFGADLTRLLKDVEEQIESRGLALARQRLAIAVDRISQAENLPFDDVVIDGFFSFASSELRMIEALAQRVSVLVTLPDSQENALARRRLIELGFKEQRMTAVHRAPKQDSFCAPTTEREIEEIARRILDHVAKGREFGEIGIVLRSPEPYAPALETTLARFGIPARLYFARPMHSHPRVQYFVRIIGALLARWPHEDLVSLVRMPVSGLGGTPEGDRLDFALRTLLPGEGLPVRGLAGPPELFSRLAALDPWLRERLAPAEWAERLKTLQSFAAQAAMPSSREEISLWQSGKAANDVYNRALDAAALALDASEALALSAFWTQARIAVEVEPLRSPDRRRNVVHVLDVFEARQWELPVVFLCGLTERNFPQYHRQDPLLDDAARRSLELETSAARQERERLLFHIAVSRATEETILSRPCFDHKGDALLPSFFLDGATAPLCETRSRPIPRRPRESAPTRFRIVDDSLRERLAGAHKRLSPTRIESFLQCPFQFFARYTLRLARRPPKPGDRLDVLAQGSILHRALAEIANAPLLGVGVLDAVLSDECRRLRVPQTYRTEAIRLELLRNFEAFLDRPEFALGWTARIEEKFEYAPNPLLTIAGRIDRLEIGPGDQAIVIDYKYSGENAIRGRIEEHDEGNLVQGGLYLAAAAHVLHLKPVGMLYCGLRKQVNWDGWHVPMAGLEGIGASVTPDALREMMNTSVASAIETQESILTGRIAAKPTDKDKCRYCDFRDICRVESIEKSREAAW